MRNLNLTQRKQQLSQKSPLKCWVGIKICSCSTDRAHAPGVNRLSCVPLWQRNAFANSFRLTMGCGTSSKCSPETEKEADDNLGDSIIFVNDSKEETKEVPDEEFSTLERESLDAHNSYRKLHGSEQLVLSRKLCQMAQAYADEIAVSKDFKHSTKLRRLFKESNAGENLAAHRSKKEGGIFTGNLRVSDFPRSTVLFGLLVGAMFIKVSL